jgi:hypothetical protein
VKDDDDDALSDVKFRNYEGGGLLRITSLISVTAMGKTIP